MRWINMVAGVLGAGLLGAAALPAAPSGALPAGIAQSSQATRPSLRVMLAWGDNFRGQLGDGASGPGAYRNEPVPVHLPSGTTVTAIAASSSTSLALTSRGQVLAWGDNEYGELGDGTNTQRKEPVRVRLPAGLKVTAIAAGSYHSLALTSHGQVLAWGNNYNGELGDGKNTNSSTPVDVSLPPGTTVKAIAAGSYHSLALTSRGQVLAWGLNNFGQLGNAQNGAGGDDYRFDRNEPVEVRLPTDTTVTEIAAGRFYSLALTSGGQVLAWGDNEYGELGDGNYTSENKPVEARLPADTTVTEIAGGLAHSLALTSNGHLLAWGSNTYGQHVEASNTPVDVGLPSGTRVTAITTGDDHSLALTSNGHLLAWGSNTYGQLGDGSSTNENEPVEVRLPSGTTATAIAAAGSFSLAIFRVQLPAPIAAVFVASHGYMPDSWEGNGVVYLLVDGADGRPDWVFVYKAATFPPDGPVTSTLQSVRDTLNAFTEGPRGDDWTFAPPTADEIEFARAVMSGEREPW